LVLEALDLQAGTYLLRKPGILPGFTSQFLLALHLGTLSPAILNQGSL
jgi:hypothetical protein